MPRDEGTDMETDHAQKFRDMRIRYESLYRMKISEPIEAEVWARCMDALIFDIRTAGLRVAEVMHP